MLCCGKEYEYCHSLSASLSAQRSGDRVRGSVFLSLSLEMLWLHHWLDKLFCLSPPLFQIVFRGWARKWGLEERCILFYWPIRIESLGELSSFSSPIMESVKDLEWDSNRQIRCHSFKETQNAGQMVHVFLFHPSNHYHHHHHHVLVEVRAYLDRVWRERS